MEVACSLEDVARALADSGYNFSDESCVFPNAADLPSVLSALDSPDSFPESPCSDEDIARVLDIARMPSPSLLDTSCNSCSHPFLHQHHHHQPHHQHYPLHHHHLPSPAEGHPERSYGVATIQKTRDPCIANAVLQTSLLPTFHTNNREPTSLDLFSIALNCSFHDDNTPPIFNPVAPTTKEVDTFNNYFNSSSALSPVSETDTLLPGSSEPHTITKQSNATPNHIVNTVIESNTHKQPSHPSSASNNTPRVGSSPIPDFSDTTNPPQVNTTQSKRKRRRKSGHVTPKPKRRKQQQDNSKAAPKPKTTPKPKTNKNKKDIPSSNLNELPLKSSYAGETSSGGAAKRKSANANAGQRKPKKSKNVSAVLEAGGKHKAGPCTAFSAPSNKETTDDARPAASTSTAIGSTNGVAEDTKGPRRSSRSTKNAENYNFRLSSLVKRVETERKQQEPKQPKGKVKPAPLSKYRRRTANARERDRMKEINDAYEVLKDALPDMEPEEGNNKITKFTILKLALNYISSLQDILDLDPTRPYCQNDDSSSSSILLEEASTSTNTAQCPNMAASSDGNVSPIQHNDPRTNGGGGTGSDLGRSMISKTQQELDL